MNGSIPCPCGQCTPCRINRRRVWSHRIMLESFMHSDKCFLTLTYDDDHVPSDGSLDPRHVQLFMKRFRKEVAPASLRFLLVGEYGDESFRPHYHLALFGFDCLGKRTLIETGVRCYCDNCELVRVTWGKGNIVIDLLNLKTAAYIARYVVKKMTSIDDPRLGGRYPEFQRQSNRPGIAARAADNIFSAMNGILSEDGDVPKWMSTHGLKLPLGRYMINALRSKAGIEEVSKEKFLAEMQDVFSLALLDKENSPISLKHVLVKNNLGRVALLESREIIYSQKGSI